MTARLRARARALPARHLLLTQDWVTVVANQTPLTEAGTKGDSGTLITIANQKILTEAGTKGDGVALIIVANQKTLTEAEIKKIVEHC